ncbi:MAG: SpoIIE family protein phosphatase [Clostridia bacterium]|nr:SpoIIE family protein phosphatase [Clostridia bacterium]
MFQNIKEDTIEINRKYTSSQERKLNRLSNVFAKENLLLYLVSFMLSFVSLNGEFSIFSISMLGACLASSVPALGVVIISLIGNFIKFGVGGALGYFLTALIMVVTLLILKPRYNEEQRNEKIKIGKNVWIATLFIQIVKFAIAGFTLYDILASVTLSIIALVFYKIFVNSLVVVQEFYQERAFSIEEIIGASLLLAIAVGGLGNFNILGFSICNILSILIVMILGWKNGILVGTTAGVTIGVTLGVISGSEPIMIAAYAISGMIAGVLNRFGKIGVVIGFTLGNVVLAYVSNGYTVELIHFKEILIASIGLLAVPKTLHIDLEEFVGNSKFLPMAPNRALNKSKEMAQSLNHVSEAIQEMATSYRTVESEFLGIGTDSEENKKIFIGELLNNLEPYKENMLYDDVADTEGKILDEIFQFLLDKQEITNQDLLKIFANCNSYIVGLDDKNISQYLETNISQMVRTINLSYKVSKSNFIWRKKVEENKRNIGKQLDGVCQAIQSMAKDLEQDFETEEQYTKEKTKILEFMKQKNMEIEDISILKTGRFIIEVYANEMLDIDTIKQIEQILTKVLKESIVFNEEASIGKRINFLSDDKYVMAIGQAETIKSKSDTSGDSLLNIRLKDGKYLVAISDGMGSGKEAKQSSTQALRLLENLLLSGFDKKVSLNLINTALINQDTEIFATLDIAIIDLYAGNIEFIKSGACPTYIKNKKRVQMIKSNSLPTGILAENSIQTFDKDIVSGDILLMCSDGILDSNIEYKNKELWVKYMLEDIETNNTQKISDLILKEAIDNHYGVAKDDMSILTCKFMKKEDA